MSVLDIFKNNTDARHIKSMQPLVARIGALEEQIKNLSDDAFPKKTAELKERISQGESPDAILPEAFALVREAARRTLGQRHYDVQLLGGIVLTKRMIAEMKTGEGKTLVATLPAYLNALSGKGVHIITVNDYLARRDADWMGQVYAFLGLSVGIINGQNTSYIYDPKHSEADQKRDEVGSFKVMYEFLRPVGRKEAYDADITYGTNSEFGFDYLRDNLAVTPGTRVQRGHHFALVDEIDSILIDEARTPLIISAPVSDSEKLYTTFAKIAATLNPEEDYIVDEKHSAIQLTDNGIAKAEKALGVDNIYTEKGIKYVHHLETAVRARALFHKDKEYVIKDNEVIIVDPFTGRLQPGRRWSEGLHQAIEAKEGVKVDQETRAAASITYQNFFRMYEKLSGMTGTAKTSAEEFYKVYGLDVVTVPTNKPIARVDHKDLIFQTEKGKFKAIAQKIKELNMKGQPVLIGTISIEKNELLSAYLHQEGVPHTMLNAKNHEKEGEIVAQAGRKGGVTIATNMAGRGVDISLGGKPTTPELAEEVKSAGGLFVLGTERHEARRIDNQLRGRSGRQGDPGETQFYVSLEDELMRVFGSDRIKTMMGRFGIPEDQPISNSFISKALESAQAKIEGFHFDARKHTLEYDDVLNHQRTIVYKRRSMMLESPKEDILNYIQDLSVHNPEMGTLAEEKRALLGDDIFVETVRRIVLYLTDLLWSEHLETMERTREAVNLRAYGQREPIVEYKKEGLRLFKEMEQYLEVQVFEILKTTTKEGIGPQQAPKEEINATVPIASPEQGEKVGRNDLCPCGSGKKYKKCGLLNTKEHQERTVVQK